MRLPSFTRPVTGARTRLVCGATFAFALAAGASVWAAFSGAIYTSDADGTASIRTSMTANPSST